jgi:hypothetical protein
LLFDALSCFKFLYGTFALSSFGAYVSIFWNYFA